MARRGFELWWRLTTDFLDPKIPENIKAVDQLIDSFEDLARRYCKLLEAETPIGASIFAHECLILLLRLYEGAMRLPGTDACEEEAPQISHETWKTMFDSISARMPGRDSYWTLRAAGLKPPSPVAGSLADDVADIWRDLKSGLLLIDNGGPNCRNSAVWSGALALKTIGAVTPLKPSPFLTPYTSIAVRELTVLSHGI